MEVKIHTDGGALGNPGPSAIGIVIELPDTKKTYAEDIGEGTNNEAEYKALIFALKKTKTLLSGAKAKQSNLTCFADSELMVKQLNHQYQIKNDRIAKLFIEVWNLILEYKKVEFIHVMREKNQEADSLVKSIFAKRNQRSFI